MIKEYSDNNNGDRGRGYTGAKAAAPGEPVMGWEGREGKETLIEKLPREPQWSMPSQWSMLS